MTSLTVKIPPELKTRLEIEARLSGKSVSAVVRNSVEEQLRIRKKGKRRLSLYERTKHLCGSLRSGVKDLATNPKYLEGLGEWRR